MFEGTTSLDDLNYILTGRSATTVKAMFHKAGTEKARFRAYPKTPLALNEIIANAK